MIMFAIKNKGIVYAYSESKELIIKESGNLYNYTDNTVAIERNNTYYIYNDKGSLICSYPQDFVDMSNIAGMMI